MRSSGQPFSAPLVGVGKTLAPVDTERTSLLVMPHSHSDSHSHSQILLLLYTQKAIHSSQTGRRDETDSFGCLAGFLGGNGGLAIKLV